MLAWRLLMRNARSGEVKILSAAMVLAVAVVTAITVFTGRMEQSLERQSNSFLAADRVVSSRFSMPEAWLLEAQGFAIQQAQTAQFNSMVFSLNEPLDDSGSAMQLASVKAVSAGYPLRGELFTSDVAFAADSDSVATRSIPEPGQLWVDSRLLALLDIELGDSLALGEKDFIVSRVIIREPDQTNGFAMFGPRVMMNISDLAATDVIREGSRIRYQWLVAGENDAIDQFSQWLKPKLGEHYRLLTVRDAQRSIRSALDRGSQFLLLAGMIGVLLASVAIAIAARQFAERHTDQVALMKSLGASRWRVRQLYFTQLLWLALLATAVGVAVGELLQRLISLSVSSFYNVALLESTAWAYGTGVLTGVICLLTFALPPLWYLPSVSPLKVLRRELASRSVHVWLRGLLGVSGVVLLVALYSRSLLLTAAVVAGLILLIVLAGLAGWILLGTSRQLGMRAGSVWRLALSNLERNRAQSITQLIVFGCAFMLLLVLFLLRTSLIDEWRLQLPDNAPNHFLLNIAGYERESVKTLLQKRGLKPEPFYPMVMGRISHLNQRAVSEDQREKYNALRRELNLSWSKELAADNKIEQGLWWDNWQSQQGLPGVSVEQKVAEELSLSIGDTVTFSLGGLTLQAEVASIRSLQWESMRPNFYFLFAPGALETFSPNYMTSVHIPSQQKSLINGLLRSYPTVVVIEADRIIERIKTIVDQIGRVIELVLWLVVVGGMLVLAAAVNASMATRRQEAGLLRALGSGRNSIMGSLFLEFTILGLLAGILAVVGGEGLVAALQVTVFKQSATLHPMIWIATPIISALFIGCLGLLACRSVVTTPPATVLRETNSY